MGVFAGLLLLPALPGFWFSLWAAHERGISSSSDLLFTAFLLTHFAAMISGAMCLLVRTPRTWRIAYLSLFIATIVPVLGMFTVTRFALNMRAAAGPRMGSDPVAVVLLLLILSLWLAVTLGPLMYLTRAETRWAYQLEALMKPTAKRATWLVGIIWLLLAIAFLFTSFVR
jgi:hypothetical protein